MTQKTGPRGDGTRWVHDGKGMAGSLPSEKTFNGPAAKPAVPSAASSASVRFAKFKTDPRTFADIAADRETPVEDLTLLASHPDPVVRLNAVKNPSATSEVYGEALNVTGTGNVTADVAIRMEIAQKTDSEEDLRTLASDRNLAVSAAAIANPNCPQSVVEARYDHGMTKIRCSVASHPKTSTACLDRMAFREIETVAAKVKTYREDPYSTVQDKEKLDALKQSSGKVRDKILTNPKCSPEAFAALINDTNTPPSPQH